jgi:hypothetical protein
LISQAAAPGNFLQPYREANQQLEPEFTALFALIKRDPEQTARLQRLKTGFQAWQQEAAEAIAPPTPALDSNFHMLERKREMDGLHAIRTQAPGWACGSLAS